MVNQLWYVQKMLLLKIQYSNLRAIMSIRYGSARRVKFIMMHQNNFEEKKMRSKFMWTNIFQKIYVHYPWFIGIHILLAIRFLWWITNEIHGIEFITYRSKSLCVFASLGDYYDLMWLTLLFQTFYSLCGFYLHNRQHRFNGRPINMRNQYVLVHCHIHCIIELRYHNWQCHKFPIQITV